MNLPTSSIQFFNLIDKRWPSVYQYVISFSLFKYRLSFVDMRIYNTEIGSFEKLFKLANAFICLGRVNQMRFICNLTLLFTNTQIMQTWNEFCMKCENNIIGLMRANNSTPIFVPLEMEISLNQIQVVRVPPIFLQDPVNKLTA